MTMDDLKKILASTKDKTHRVKYSKETLMILSRNTPCHTPPSCLLPTFFSEDGYWDPELWHQTLPPTSSLNQEDAQQNDDILEESDVVLGPQRRSFQGGCHVSTKPSSARPHFGSSSKASGDQNMGKLSHQSSSASQDLHRPQLKRLHSYQNHHSEWSRDNAKKSFERSTSVYSRKPPDKKQFSTASNRRYSASMKQRYHEEIEPEWISFGPDSQFDTIDLQGFETGDDFSWMGGEIPMDDVPRKKHHVVKDISKQKTKANDDIKMDLKEKQEAVEDIKDDVAEALPESQNGVDNEERHDGAPRSRFRHWFNSGLDIADKGAVPNTVTEVASKFLDNITLEETTSPDDDLSRSNEDIKKLIDTTDSFDEETNSAAGMPLKEQRSEKASPSANPVSLPNSSSGTADLHGTDAFNRLIASIRATDKVKEQMQLRNQQIQALQSVMSASRSRSPASCLTLASLENASDDVSRLNSQDSNLKQQLEKQKDAYQRKLRQIEQQQTAPSPLLPGQDPTSQLSNKIRSLASPSRSSLGRRISSDISQESAVATASLAAKLAGKVAKDDNPNVEQHGSRNAILSMPFMGTRSEAAILRDNLKNHKPSGLPSFTSELGAMKDPRASYDDEGDIAKKQSHQRESALQIAQMLAKAGVTEDQLKQLTIEQQEMVISMVRGQFARKDMNKLKQHDLFERQAERSAGSSLRNSLPFMNHQSGKPPNELSHPDDDLLKILSSHRQSSLGGVTHLTDNGPSMGLPTYSDNAMLLGGVSNTTYNQSTLVPTQPAPQTRLYTQNILSSHLHPALVSSIHPRVVAPAPHMLPRTLPPQLSPLVHSQQAALASTHPALMFQMQQQLYANQVAQQQQQQQQAVLAAFHKQQLETAVHHQQNDLAKLQQNVQKLRLGSAHAAPPVDGANQDSHFTNPLSQWFSREVLRQSQYSPAAQASASHAQKTMGNIGTYNPDGKQ